MNDTLRFSWGHIIAFLAIIAVIYLTFVGDVYHSDGNFVHAGVVTAIVALVLLGIFIGAQMSEATDCHFKRWIVVERILIVSSPVVFILAMLPYFHFWTVHSHDKEIVEAFKSTISSAEGLFPRYEGYAHERCTRYDEMLERLIGNRASQREMFTRAGLIAGKEEQQRTVMVKTLQLQLLSTNYDTLKKGAIAWIDAATTGASTFNVFYLGNVKKIRESVDEWNRYLVATSNTALTNERLGDNDVDAFSANNPSITAVHMGLDSITAWITKGGAPTIGSILLAAFLYFCLLLPYLLQDRHTKSPFRSLFKAKEQDPTIFTLNDNN